MTVRALSIHQPYATAAARGLKPVENRDWPTRYLGPLLLHASLATETLPAYLAALLPTDFPPLAELPTGGIVGAVILAECVRAHDSPWFVGTFGFVLEAALELPLFPCRGQQGFFQVTLPDHYDALLAPLFA